jgi:hypothetical protein
VSGNINVECAGLIAGKPAPTVFAVSLVFASAPIPCGLARDGGVSGEIDVGCAGLIAGKPAPTVFVVSLAFADDPIHCGSWLASDGDMSGDIGVGCAGLIAGKPAPMYGLAPTVYPLLKNRCPVASMY